MSAWILAAIIVAVAIVAGCALWINAATDTAEEIMDFAERVYCYDTGFQDARYGLDQRAPAEAGSACEALYDDGYGDGLAGVYGPPPEE